MKYLDRLKTKKAFEIIFITTVGMSFLLWLIFLFIGGSESNQFDVFAGRCVDFIADSSNVVGYSAARDPYHNTIFGLGEKAYPPLPYVLLYFISKIVDTEAFGKRDGTYYFLYSDVKYLVVFIILLIIVMILMYTLIQVTKKGKMPIKIMTSLVLCCSAPMLFSIERGNTIILSVLFSMFYLFYYNSENKILKEFALISLAISAGFKVTPAILGIMLLYNKQFKEALRSVIYGIVTVVGPFLFLKGGFNNIQLMFNNMQLYLQSYSSTEGCTLTASVNRFGKLLIDDFTMNATMINCMRIVTITISILLLGSAPFLKKNWEKVAAVIVVLIILPSHSGQYCILYMLPVIVMFLNEEKYRNIDFMYLFCMIMVSWVFLCKITDVFNYNLAIPIIVVGLLVTAINNMIKYRKNQSKGA